MLEMLTMTSERECDVLIDTFCFELIPWLRSNGNVVFVNFKHFAVGCSTETENAKLEMIQMINLKNGFTQINVCYYYLFIVILILFLN